MIKSGKTGSVETSNTEDPKNVTSEDNKSITVGHIDGLLLAFEMNGHILAAQARIDGMKTENAVSASGGMVTRYRENDFLQEARNIESYASYLRVMRKVGPEKFHRKYTEGVVENENTKKDMEGN